MVEKVHITTGNFDGSSYLILSSGSLPSVTSFKYRQPDKYIIRMFKKRRTCSVPPNAVVPSIWTTWLKEKNKNL